MKTIFEIEIWDRYDYLDHIREQAETRLFDDSSYPCVYLEQIARHDPRLFDGFVRDVLDDMGATVLKECEQYGGLSRDEIEQAILKVIKAAADEWEQMTPEEQEDFGNLIAYVAHPSGTYAQRWNSLNWIWLGFIEGRKARK